MRTLVVCWCVALAASGVLAAPGDAEVPRPAPRVSGGAWANLLKGGHPRLLGPVADLQAKAKAQPEVFRAMKADTDQELIAGIVHAVEGAPDDRVNRWLERARKNVARGPTNVHQDSWIWLQEVCFAYDFFHSRIGADERQRWITWMNAHLEKFTDDEGAFHNSTPSKMLCYLRIAYATWGENPRARDFRDHAIGKLYEARVLPVLNEFGGGGGFTECGWYSRHSVWDLVHGLELARRFEGYDGFAKAPRFFYQRIAYNLHEAFPGLWLYGAERFGVEGDGSALYGGGYAEGPRHTRTILSQYFRGSELARFASAKRRKGSNLFAQTIDFLYAEEPDAPLPLAGFPTAHLVSGIGRVYARSDWSDDAAFLRFECGDYWNNHQHLEVGNFEIFRYEPLATETGEYTDYGNAHAVNWLLRTVAHNCILVHQEGETWRMMRDGGRNKYANDGGQTAKWEWVQPDLPRWQAKRQQFERGDLVGYENQDAWLYVAGDCTAAYAPSKLNLWVRQIVFLRPGTFIIFDRVVSTKPEYAKTWLLHCRNQPQIDETTVKITSGRGQLDVQTLLPEKARLTTVEGYTYGGQTFDPPVSALSKEAIRWRLEVKPGTPATEDLFLHVLSTHGPVAAKLVWQGGAVGVEIAQARVLFEGKVGGKLTLGEKTLPLEARIKAGPWER